MDSYKTTFKTWNKIASIYENKFMDVNLYNDTYSIFCNLITKPKPTIFEIGCGPGNITKYLLLQKPNFKIKAIDVAPNMVKLAKANNPAAKFKIMDCRKINTITTKFDAIMCGFCMPYLSKTDCIKLIKDCACLLNTNGLFYFSTIKGNYNKSGFKAGSSGDACYVYYYPQKFFEEVLKQNNFKVIELIKKAYQNTSATIETHLIFIVQKK